MIADLFAIVSIYGDLFLHRFFVVLTYPLHSEQRIFVVWLFTSLLFALFVFFQSLPSGRPGHSGGLRAFFRFLFPTAVWRQRSAWLDVRYFFFHQVFRVCLFEGVLTATVSAAVFHKSSDLLTRMRGESSLLASEFTWGLEYVYTLLSVLLTDFAAYALHYYQHKNPLLWEFHKVHHSPSVMHPLTNYREHPIDNLFYALGHGVALGLSGGLISHALGYIPETPTIFGVALFSFLFNALGYNLRHSHIWLRWPGKWSYVFGCPAHHHIHHSCHPEHIDKNFAFILPLWDVVFGTFCLPDDNSKVKFGLGDGQEDVYSSCLSLYFLPLKNGLSQLRAVFLPQK